jgi:hypothetical protein
VEEAKEELSWMDWILTDTERGKKRELSEEKEPESREDILAALNHEEENEEEVEESAPISDRWEDSACRLSPPLLFHSLTQRISVFFNRMAPQSFFGRSTRANSSSQSQRETAFLRNPTTTRIPSQQEFQLNKEALQRSCFRCGAVSSPSGCRSHCDRLVHEICEPVLGKGSFVLHECYSSIPDCLLLTLSSIAYTMTIDRLESDYSGFIFPSTVSITSSLLLQGGSRAGWISTGAWERMSRP